MDSDNIFNKNQKVFLEDQEDQEDICSVSKSACYSSTRMCLDPHNIKKLGVVTCTYILQRLEEYRE